MKLSVLPSLFNRSKDQSIPTHQPKPTRTRSPLQQVQCNLPLPNSHLILHGQPTLTVLRPGPNPVAATPPGNGLQLFQAAVPFHCFVLQRYEQRAQPIGQPTVEDQEAVFHLTKAEHLLQHAAVVLVCAPTCSPHRTKSNSRRIYHTYVAHGREFIVPRLSGFPTEATLTMSLASPGLSPAAFTTRAGRGEGHSISCMDVVVYHTPSHPCNPGTEHVGFSLTRHTLLAPSAKRCGVSGASHEG